jgi:hypothetical protein
MRASQAAWVAHARIVAKKKNAGSSIDFFLPNCGGPSKGLMFLPPETNSHRSWGVVGFGSGQIAYPSGTVRVLSPLPLVADLGWSVGKSCPAVGALKAGRPDSSRREKGVRNPPLLCDPQAKRVSGVTAPCWLAADAGCRQVGEIDPSTDLLASSSVIACMEDQVAREMRPRSISRDWNQPADAMGSIVTFRRREYRP